MKSIQLFTGLLASLFLCGAWAAGNPKIAVTDLSYENKVSGYFEKVEIKGKRTRTASANERYNDSEYSSSENSSARERSREEVSVRASTEFETHINRGELRKFTADIKGELLKSGYQLIQGKPWTAANTETLYDIIDRIKKGYYPGADYVLWGSINNVEFRDEIYQIEGATPPKHTKVLSLELVGEFSLINTRTYEIKAAFSAMGEGSDTRIFSNRDAQVRNNKSRVMQEVSRSLGEAVAQEVEAQFGGGSKRGNTVEMQRSVTEEKVIRYK